MSDFRIEVSVSGRFFGVICVTLKLSPRSAASTSAPFDFTRAGAIKRLVETAELIRVFDSASSGFPKSAEVEAAERGLERALNDPAHLAELARLRAEGCPIVEVPGVTIIIKRYR